MSSSLPRVFALPALLGLLVVAGGSPAHSAPAPLTPPDVRAAMPVVRQAVEPGVFFYRGSMFKDVRAGTDNSGHLYLCGWVNEDKVTRLMGWRTFTVHVWPAGSVAKDATATFSMNTERTMDYCPITVPAPGDYAADISYQKPVQPVARP